ncbi:hypothetical protein CYLTODRAFT_494561 [Cylindrobasidium torrendii FP15055 ss-10]|uniref:Uncharacterized protein n=1 Tax=Cylindrobasidium torrendii FP15055 ss-10 TaxID=1314674 RepID=A0A0D7AVY3_9AGAR|nr:hypothetical protein CYLTODRAFT_494561 [Cylindrobasidium torrendii FP15055 ss-10]
MSVEISSLRSSSHVYLHPVDGLFTMPASFSDDNQRSNNSNLARASEDTIVAECVDSQAPEDKGAASPTTPPLPTKTNVLYESAPALPVPCQALSPSVDALRAWQETNRRLQRQADAFQQKERRRYGLDLDKHEYSRWSPDTITDNDVPFCLAGVIRVFTLGFHRIRDALASR